MAWNGEIPPLGFKGEKFIGAPAGIKNRVMHIPVPHALGVIEVYAWNSSLEEGYNIFLPGSNAVSVTTPLAVQFIIHNFLTSGGNQGGDDGLER